MEVQETIFWQAFYPLSSPSPGDENKKILLDLGALDGLLRLINHEDRIVRRNACMCIGVMSTHGEWAARTG